MAHAYAISGIFLLFIHILLQKPHSKWPAGAAAGLLSICLALGIKAQLKKDAQTFDLGGAAYNGYILNFCLLFDQLHIVNYSPETVKRIVEPYISENQTEVPDKTSDIIVIMNESFADANYIGDGLSANQDVLSFVTNLTSNTIKGYALSSVYGGGTPNSEYEMLTGNTMMFLPDGAIPFQQYIDRPVYSIVSELNNLGYKTIGMHLLNSSGWQRSKYIPCWDSTKPSSWMIFRIGV